MTTPASSVRRFSIGLVLTLALGLTARAQVTIGPGIGSEGGNLDGAQTSYVFIGQGFGAGAVGLTLTSWDFFSGNTGGSLSVTPLLFQEDLDGNFTLMAIGASVTPPANTAVTNLAFNPQVGSAAITNANFYFGWKDGTQTTHNSGVISWNSIGGPESADALTGNSTQNLTSANVGTEITMGNTSLGDRTYQFDAFATSTVPEPSNFTLLAGLVGLGGALFIRRRS